MDDFFINPQFPGETKSFCLTETVSKEIKFEGQKFEEENHDKQSGEHSGWPTLVVITVRMFVCNKLISEEE